MSEQDGQTVANERAKELKREGEEYRGFRVSDLNKEGTSANADLLAARDGKTWQIQVKGASGTWFDYGYCTDAIIDKKEEMFNRHASSFYGAQIVVLVSVKTPKDYSCVVLPVEIAEKAAQINLDYMYRTPKKDGGRKKPGVVWAELDYIPPKMDDKRKARLKEEQELLRPYRDNWDIK